MMTLSNVPLASAHGRGTELHSVEGSPQISCVACQHVTNKYTNTSLQWSMYVNWALSGVKVILNTIICLGFSVLLDSARSSTILATERAAILQTAKYDGPVLNLLIKVNY